MAERTIARVPCASGDGMTMTLSQKGPLVQLTTRTLAGCTLVFQMTPETALVWAKNVLIESDAAASSQLL